MTWAVQAALGADLDETVVVSGAADLSEVLEGPVTLLCNCSWAMGQATSLQVALDWCRQMGHGAAVVGLGDQPLVGSDAWRRISEASALPIAVATYRGRRRNPVRLDRSVWDLLSPSGDEGARGLMRRRPELVGEVACHGEPGDVDTLEDLQRWS